MGQPWILAIDLGTGGPKTAAVTVHGEILAAAARTVATRYAEGGVVRQDPEGWWHGITCGVQDLITAGVQPGDAAGVGITGQWGSTVPVDAAGTAVGECLLWSDTSGAALSRAAMGGPLRVAGYSPLTLLPWWRITGGAPSLYGADPLGHELRLRTHEPERYAAAATLMEPLDYLGMRLTGRRAATPASMVLSWLTDNRAGGHAAYVPWLVRRSGRNPQKLPPLLPTGSTLGTLLPGVARELGLPQDIRVVAGVPDLHTAYVGSGAVAPFQAHSAISTSGWISCAVPFKRTDVLHQMATVPGVRRGTYLVANNHETAGVCLQWLAHTLAENRAGAPPDYARLTTLAAAAQPGSGGVLFTPWLNGERSPVEDRALRAAFLNLSMATQQGDLVRAVMEGVAFNTRWLLDAMERFVRQPLPALRLLGGGATSELWCQIHADVMGRPVEMVAQPMQASLRGAALFAAMSLQLIAFDDIHERVPIAARFEPEPAHAAVYARMYGEFRRLYRRLRPLYARLNRGDAR